MVLANSLLLQNNLFIKCASTYSRDRHEKNATKFYPPQNAP